VSNAPSASLLAGPPRKLPLIAEGDSWFKLPDVHPPVPRTLIDFLQPQFSTVNLAHWGDALADIILKGQFWPYLQSGSSDVFLFSGGGNDVLGLELFDVDHARPKDAPYYLNQDFYDNLNVIISSYERLINAIKLRAPHVVMLGMGMITQSRVTTALCSVVPVVNLIRLAIG
jgi:hypothetical protein